MNSESIETRHRKEKKELQAQVTALKKAAKNDKTKKKELTVEITRLEIELEERHKQELEQVECKVNLDVDSDEAIVPDIEVSKIKISKAQKRRDKKSQQEKEREAQIKLQQQENINGPRNLEVQSIMSRLKDNHLNLYHIPSDGDCLYKAVSHQLQTIRDISLTVEELRKKTSDYIQKNKQDFIPFMSNPQTCEMLTDEEFEEYCDKIANTKDWGGQLEIRALSNCLKCPIRIIQATGPESIDQGMEYEGQPLILTYHRHMYSLGEHYNSTQRISPDPDADED